MYKILQYCVLLVYIPPSGVECILDFCVYNCGEMHIVVSSSHGQAS